MARALTKLLPRPMRLSQLAIAIKIAIEIAIAIAIKIAIEIAIAIVLYLRCLKR